MSDTSTLGLPEAARRLGVSLRVLRHAIRVGKIPAPPHLSATSFVSAEWLASAQAVAQAKPKALSWNFAQKVPPFARYEGTSAWRKCHNRVREYARFHAKAG